MPITLSGFVIPIPEVACLFCQDFAMAPQLIQIVDFPTRIHDCDDYQPYHLDLFLWSYPDYCSVVSQPPLGKSDYLVVSVVKFVVKSINERSYHRTVYSNKADWHANSPTMYNINSDIKLYCWFGPSDNKRTFVINELAAQIGFEKYKVLTFFHTYGMWHSLMFLWKQSKAKLIKIRYFSWIH